MVKIKKTRQVTYPAGKETGGIRRTLSRAKKFLKYIGSTLSLLVMMPSFSVELLS